MKAAVKAAVKEELDAEVKAGRFTQAQADEMLERLTEHLDDFGDLRRACGESIRPRPRRRPGVATAGRARVPPDSP